MDPALQELMHGNDDEQIEAIIKLKDRNRVPEGITKVATFGDVATCRLQRGSIHEIWSDDRVLSLKAPRFIGVSDESDAVSQEVEEGLGLMPLPADLRRPPGLPQDGTGTVLGVIDFGCDFAHPNLIDDSGNSRLLALWDQRGGTTETSPQPYGYGRLFQRSDIDIALHSDDPYTTLGYHPADADPFDTGSHGMHVIDIAAGNGRAADSPLGIAPSADLVFVHLSAGSLSGLSDLGDSVRILEALDFIHKIAGDRPCVINTSLGRHAGLHNGKTLVEQGIDAMLTENVGRLVVQSCGNYYRAQAHAAGRLSPGRSRTLTWVTHRADITPNEFEVWYQGQDRFGIELHAPDHGPVFRAALGERSDIVIDSVQVGTLYHRAKDPAAGDNHINVFLQPDAPAGAWRIVLNGEDIVDGRYHAWVERDAACRGCQSRFSDEDADPTCTTGTICNGFYSVAVGAYDAHREGWPLVTASSSGPTRDGRSKPDLVAPGGSILAARSHPRNSEATVMTTRKSGTSMAAPHVAGTALLMFQAAGRPLNIFETRRALLGTLDVLQTQPNQQYRVGNGYLNIARAVEAAEQMGSDNGGAMEQDIEKTDMEFEPEMPGTKLFGVPRIQQIEARQDVILDASHMVEENTISDVKTPFYTLEHDSTADATARLVHALKTETTNWETTEAEQPAVINAEYSSWSDDSMAQAYMNPLPLTEPDALFDRILNDVEAVVAQLAKAGLELLAAPGTWLGDDLHRGDLLVVRALGEGSIATVAEIAAIPSMRNDSFELRRLGHDNVEKKRRRFRRIRSGHRVPRNTLLLRPHRWRHESSQDSQSMDGTDILYSNSVTMRSVFSEATPHQSFRAARFSGDPVLDAVLNSQQLLRSGSNGTAVQKVQQALLDLGFSLPRFGADGKFGNETKVAVTDFQRDQRRFVPSIDIDGIVGHDTMERLDIAFGIRTRINVQLMTTREQARLVRAIQELRNRGIYHNFVRDHANSMPTAHRQPAFLPWHRQFILNFETELRAIDSAISLPYWDWAADPGIDSAGRPMWNAAMQTIMGENGSGPNHAVTTGPFAGWQSINSSGVATALPLARDFGAASWATALPTIAEVNAVLGITPYDQSPWDDAASTGGFRNELEGWANGNSLHNVVHGWVGGSMLPGTSPNDPCFFLHHCFVDKIWADWQARFPAMGYLPLTRQTRPGLADAFGLHDDVPVASVTGSSPVTFKPSETINLTTLKDHRGNSGIEVNYI